MLKWHINFAFNSFKIKKARSLIIIVSICFSVGIFVTANGAVDTLNKNIIKSSFSDLSSSDIIITRSNNDLIDNKSISNIEKVLPDAQLKGISLRIRSDGALTYFNKNNEQISNHITVIGINFTLENSLGLGQFSPNIKTLPSNQCLIIGSLNRQVSSSFNNSLTLSLYISSNPVNVSIAKWLSVNQEKKFSNDDKNIVVVNIDTFYQFFPFQSSNEIVGIFNDHNNLYSLSNFDNTINTVRQRATILRNSLGYDFKIQIPIAQKLTNIKASLGFSQVILNLISFLLISITVILVYSLFTSSVEEKIHEFGIFRAIGIPNQSIVFQIFLQSIILSLIGTFFGIFLSIILLLLYLPSFFSVHTNFLSYFNFIQIGLIIGLGSSLLASIFPAMQSTKTQILNAIDVSRTESSEYKKRITSYRTTLISWKRVFWGIFLSSTGTLILVIYPGIQYFYGQETVNSVFFILLIVQFLGFILIFLGFFGPLLEKILLKSFSMVTREKSFVVNLFLRKNLKRNLTTMMIYAMAFSFIFFLTFNNGWSYQVKIFDLKQSTGSNYQIISNNPSSNFLLDNQTLNFTKNYPTLRSSFVTTPDLSSIIGANIIIGDQIDFNTFTPDLYGTDGSLLSALFNTYELAPGSNFTKINDNNSIVISSSIAKSLNAKIGDQIKIKIFSPVQNTNDRFKKEYSLNIVGIAYFIPGFTDVSNQQNHVTKPAVFVGFKTWSTFVRDNLDSTTQKHNMYNYIEKIFVKQKDNTPTNFKNDIFIKFGTKIGIRDYQSELSTLEKAESASVNGVALILSLSTVLTLFAVFSSTSSSIIESRKDIELLKAIGLNNNDISNIFVLESFIICLVASLIGSFTGSIVEYMVGFNTAIYNDFPLVIIIYPPLTVIVTFLMALFFSYIGSKLPAKKISSLNITEIFR